MQLNKIETRKEKNSKLMGNPRAELSWELVRR